MAGAPTAAGFAYFAGVKAIGYTAAAAVFKHGYQAIAPVKTNVVTVGLSRTGIGLAAGLIYGGLWILAANLIRNPSDSLPLYYYIFLLPVILGLLTAEPCPRRERVTLEGHCSQKPKVPEGLPTIARRFNAG